MALLNISDLTGGTLTSGGAFDRMMLAITAHLESQFTSGRITGAEYATVYLGAMQYAIDGAVRFSLGASVAELNTRQAELVVKQGVHTDAQTTLTNKQTDIALKEIDVTVEKVKLTTAQTVLTDKQADIAVQEAIATGTKSTLNTSQSLLNTKQIELTTAQITLTNKQADIAIKEADVTVEKVKLTTAQTLLADEQTGQVHSETISKKQQSQAELMLAQQKLISEKLGNGEKISQYIWEVEYNQNPGNTYTYITVEELTENDVGSRMNFDPHVLGYTVKTISLNQVVLIKPAGISIAETQITKGIEETNVLAQKVITEYAQTQVSTKTSPAISSVIGRQTSLFENQAAGFKWDAKNTHNKNLVDLDKMRMNVSGLVSSTTGTPSVSGYSFTIPDPTSTP